MGCREEQHGAAQPLNFRLHLACRAAAVVQYLAELWRSVLTRTAVRPPYTTVLL